MSVKTRLKRVEQQITEVDFELLTDLLVRATPEVLTQAIEKVFGIEHNKKEVADLEHERLCCHFLRSEKQETAFARQDVERLRIENARLREKITELEGKNA